MAHFKRLTVKKIIFILTILALTGFISFDNNETTEPEFKIKISYIGLPHPVRTNYDIDNKRLTVYKTSYDNKNESFIDKEKRTFRKFDSEELIKFLQRTNWTEIPEKLETPTIDGFHYFVQIELENGNYTFDIDNTYHITFDSLFTICNDLVPTKKVKEQYYLPYSDWR